jgi:hypothetical protein
MPVESVAVDVRVPLTLPTSAKGADAMDRVNAQLDLSPRRAVAAVYLFLGFWLLALGLAFPWLAKDPWAGLLLITLPCLLAGGLALASGWAMARTRLVLGEQGLEMRLSGWRGFPCPPARRWHLTWRQIRGIERQTLLLRTFIMIGPLPALSRLAVEVFILETDQGRIILAGKILPRLPQAMALLAARCGIAVKEGGQRQASLLRIMWKGELPAG